MMTRNDVKLTYSDIGTKKFSGRNFPGPHSKREPRLARRGWGREWGRGGEGSMGGGKDGRGGEVEERVVGEFAVSMLDSLCDKNA